MFSSDIYSIHGEAELVASVCDRERMILDRYSEEHEHAEDSREFRSFRRMMQGNVGVRL